MAELSTSDPKSAAHQLGDSSPASNTVQTTLDKFLRAATVEAVYSSPVGQGENMVIPAAEVLSIVGFGVGLGGGRGPMDTENRGSGGGGGGGRVVAHPVAAIIMSPTGVRVEPIVDVTKIVIAVFTTLGFMASLFTRMGKRRPKLEG
jgi:uncharacterized spore protein YtfJ